jgi:hypothetical protein
MTTYSLEPDGAMIESLDDTDQLTASPDDAGHVAATLRARLEEVLDLAADDPRRTRLSNADTSVTFAVRGAESESVTLLLDRNPPTVAPAGDPAEVGIELTPAQALDYAGGGVSLGPLMLAGEVNYRGPVRKYLMVDAVFRGLFAGHWSH